jgi:serine protease Do
MKHLLAPLILVTAFAAAAEEADGPFVSANAAAQRRVVKIYGAEIGRTPGYASGLIVSAAGDILTAQAAMLSTDNLRVALADGTTHQAKVVRRSQNLQAALLKIEANTPEFFSLQTPPEVNEGDWILSVSNAFKVAEGAEPLSVNLGVISLRTPLAARRGFSDFPYQGDVYLYDAITANPGAAGGAIVTVEGRLVGMIGKVIESKSTNTRLNYAVPADLLAAFVKGEEPQPTPAPVTSTGPGELGLRLFALGGRKAPAYIDRVLPNGPAAQAGIKADDLVVTLAGQVVKDAADFRRIADALPAGREVVIEVKRKNAVLAFHLVPAAKAQD